jgi:DNA-binding NtrC family response regulator
LQTGHALRPAPFAELGLHIEPAVEGGPSALASFRERKEHVVDQFERSYLEDLMASHAGNVRAACRASGLERTQLKRLLAKHGLR